MIIYKITNLINSKVYIGQTRYSLAHRWSAHCRTRSHSTALTAAIQKYGRENFKKEILNTYNDLESLNIAEREAIKEYNSLSPNGYNLTIGGDVTPHTEMTKKKLSLSKLGDKNPMFNKKHSEEHKLKISMALKGRKRPEHVKQKLKLNHNPKSNLNLTHNKKVQVNNDLTDLQLQAQQDQQRQK